VIYLYLHLKLVKEGVVSLCCCCCCWEKSSFRFSWSLQRYKTTDIRLGIHGSSNDLFVSPWIFRVQQHKPLLEWRAWASQAHWSLEHDKIQVGMGQMNFLDFGSYEPNVEWKSKFWISVNLIGSKTLHSVHD